MIRVGSLIEIHIFVRTDAVTRIQVRTFRKKTLLFSTNTAYINVKRFHKNKNKKKALKYSNQ